jgi:hypothetical protein
MGIEPAGQDVEPASGQILIVLQRCMMITTPAVKPGILPHSTVQCHSVLPNSWTACPCPAVGLTQVTAKPAVRGKLRLAGMQSCHRLQSSR